PPLDRESIPLNVGGDSHPSLLNEACTMVPERSSCALSVEHRGGETVVRFVGDSVELDDQTALAIEKELFSLVDQHRGRDLVMDFQNVTLLNSTGLELLLGLRKRVLAAGGRLRISNVRPFVAEVFRATQLADVFSLQTE